MLLPISTISHSSACCFLSFFLRRRVVFEKFFLSLPGDIRLSPIRLTTIFTKKVIDVCPRATVELVHTRVVGETCLSTFLSSLSFSLSCAGERALYYSTRC